MSRHPQADDLAQFKATYFAECAELLAAAEGHLADLEADRAEPDTLNAVFRAVHSIKGGAGAFGFTDLVRYSHQLEALLDALRDGRIAVSRDIVATLIRGLDCLNDLVAATREDAACDLPRLEGLLADFARLAAAPAPAIAAAQPSGAIAERALQTWTIRFAPGPELLKSANEPLLLIRALKRLGRLDVDVDLSRLPPLAELDPETCFMAWTFRLETDAPESDIRDVFEFVVDDCTLTVTPAKVRQAAAVADAPTEAVRRTPSEAASTIRVDTDKIDRLVNLVGELVITQAMLIEQGSFIPVEQFPALVQGLEDLSQHARELQESVMAIRAQPVKSVFMRMPRIVRDLGATLGKDVRLVMTGEMTEIDKTVIEQLADPLTHMIRNAVDHGIEAPAEREAAGKPREGTIHLSADQRGGRIVIEIADDGRGLDKDAIRAKAIERGLVDETLSLSDEEIYGLVFRPGFSTAKVVSEVSGRGVGMDVVRRNIQSLGGRIIVDSTKGSGSRFTLALPLTLAVLDGMVVSVGSETYVIPLTSIMESLRPARADIHRLVGRGDLLAIRGEYIPLLYTHRCFGVGGADSDPCTGIVVIVETETAGRMGLVVDELIGQQQVVIKSLETNFGPVDGVSGATILGNGRVALIIDVTRLAPLAETSSSTDRRGRTTAPSRHVN